MLSERLFVWNFLPGQPGPVIAGRLDLTQTADRIVGRFVYGQSYLARHDAIALDPVTLPLVERPREFVALSGFPGVILDACPDRWGIKVIDRLMGARRYPTDYLLLNDPGRAGSLAFSRAADEAPVELASREFPLPMLMAAAEAIEQDREVDPELLKALHPGTGGARPKCNIVDDDAVWIAKFPSIEDAPGISIPRLEHATMTLATACGIRAATTKCERIAGKDVCFVKRFDRAVQGGQILRRGYASARTVFYADSGYCDIGGSYGRLATWMTRYGVAAGERSELFRRMVFNCAVRNIDDHELNHGLVHVADNRFSLADAFDVLPSLSRHGIHRHALLLGDSAAGTVENLVSNVVAFGLRREEGLAIIEEVQAKVKAQWQDIAYAAGLGDEALRLLEPFFQQLPFQKNN